jgi:hypothetical protein
VTDDEEVDNNEIEIEVDNKDTDESNQGTEESGV